MSVDYKRIVEDTTKLVREYGIDLGDPTKIPELFLGGINYINGLSEQIEGLQQSDRDLTRLLEDVERAMARLAANYESLLKEAYAVRDDSAKKFDEARTRLWHYASFIEKVAQITAFSDVDYTPRAIKLSNEAKLIINKTKESGS